MDRLIRTGIDGNLAGDGILFFEKLQKTKGPEEKTLTSQFEYLNIQITLHLILQLGLFQFWYQKLTPKYIYTPLKVFLHFVQE